MSEPVQQAQIDAANAYEALMVPALFGPWAPRVADAAGIGRGARVLDVVCGTGILAREAAARTGAGGYVAADGAVEFDTSAHIVTATKP